MSDKPKFLIIDTSVLPDVFLKVADAKRMLLSNRVKSSTDAAKKAGLSRSAFYKYRDFVFIPETREETCKVTFRIHLKDKVGELSKLLEMFLLVKASVESINQSVPIDSVAIVNITARLNSGEDRYILLERMRSLDGVVKVEEV